MQKLMTAAGLVILLGGSVALAQNSGRTRNSTDSATSSQSGGGSAAAPIGHKQPRPSDLPSQSGGSRLDDENAALDRKLKSICRGC